MNSKWNLLSTFAVKKYNGYRLIRSKIYFSRGSPSVGHLYPVWNYHLYLLQSGTMSGFSPCLPLCQCRRYASLHQSPPHSLPSSVIRSGCKLSPTPCPLVRHLQLPSNVLVIVCRVRQGTAGCVLVLAFVVLTCLLGTVLLCMLVHIVNMLLLPRRCLSSIFFLYLLYGPIPQSVILFLLLSRHTLDITSPVVDVTPLVIAEFSQDLAASPQSKNCYDLDGNRLGFRVVLTLIEYTRSRTSNLCSASDHPDIVDAFLPPNSLWPPLLLPLL